MTVPRYYLTCAAAAGDGDGDATGVQVFDAFSSANISYLDDLLSDCLAPQSLPETLSQKGLCIRCLSKLHSRAFPQSCD